MRSNRSLAARTALAAALALSGLALGACPAHATTLLDQSVAQLSNHAERIVIARVDGVRSWMEREGGIRIFTEANLTVVESLKGPAGERSFTLKQLGGTAGEGSDRRTQTIPGMPTWRQGEVVLLFLEHTDTGRLVTSALSMGKYTLEPGVGGRVMARRDVSQLNRLGMRRTPDRVFLGANASEDLLSLDDLRALIAGKRVLSFPRVLRPVAEPSVSPAAGVVVDPAGSTTVGGEVRR
jgi:hypothetical protein